MSCLEDIILLIFSEKDAANSCIVQIQQLITQKIEHEVVMAHE